MPYNTLPLTAPNWEYPTTQAANVAQTQYGEAGVIQRQRKSIINNISDQVSLDVKVTHAERTAIDSVLRANAGKMFRIPVYDGAGVVSSTILFKCGEWSWNWEGENCWMLTMSVSQVRRLNP